MQLQVKGKNLPVTDALFAHAERKLGKLARYLPPWDEAIQVELELSVEKNPSIERRQVAEVTVRTKGPVLRVRESASDMYQAIDQAAHKLERQAGRYRERRRRRRDISDHPSSPDEARRGRPGGPQAPVQQAARSTRDHFKWRREQRGAAARGRLRGRGVAHQPLSLRLQTVSEIDSKKGRKLRQ